MSAPVVRRYKATLKKGTGRIGPCARCEETVPLKARRLCDACWAAVRTHGDLEDYPRETNRLADVYVEYEMIRSGGGALEELAARIGVSIHTLRHAIRQHRLKAAR